MNDDELKRHMMELAYQGQEQRQFALNMISDELARLRITIDNLKLERDALNAILSRLVEENVALEARLPFNVIRRWIDLLRSGWRV